MPNETSRKNAKKRIIIGSGDNDFVDVPIITEITWYDAIDRGQETRHTVNNTSSSARKTHIDTLHGTNSDGTPDMSVTLDIERIDLWPVIDPISRGQQTHHSFDNVTGADDNPPHFSTHTQTHIFRYVNDAGGASDIKWIDSEIIDQFGPLRDVIDRGQVTVYTLNNPDLQADDEQEDISDSDNGIDPAWRTDPFQNIIAFGSGTASCGIIAGGLGWPTGGSFNIIFDLTIYFGPGPLEINVNHGEVLGVPVIYTATGTGMIGIIVIDHLDDPEFADKIATDWVSIELAFNRGGGLSQLNGQSMWNMINQMKNATDVLTLGGTEPVILTYQSECPVPQPSPYSPPPTA